MGKALDTITKYTCIAAMFWLAASCTLSRVQAPKALSALEKAKANVVRISDGNSSCSGVLVSSHLLLTAAHCAPEPAITIQTPMGEIVLSPPPLHLVVGGNLLSTGFVFRPDGATMRGNLGDVPEIKVDWNDGMLFSVDKAVICGYPQANNQLRCTEAKRVGNTGFFGEFDTVSIPGQSGGAAFSLDGTLIGLVSQVTDEGHTLISSVTGLFSEEPQSSANGS